MSNDALMRAAERADNLTAALARQLRYIADRLDRTAPSIKRAICGCAGDAGLVEQITQNLDRQVRGEPAQNLAEIIAHASS